MRYLLALLLILSTSALATTAAAQAPVSAETQRPVQYTLSFADADRHLVEVEALFPTGGGESLELMMPVWTPGSYLVREYARHIESIEASDAATTAALTIRKTRKNRWVVADCSETPLVRVRYRLYCREMSVRTNWVEHDFGCLTGAATFITLADDQPRPHHVRCDLPTHWARAVSAMPTAPQDDRTFIADSFDTLVDNPILLGNPSIAEFTVDDIPHQLVTLNDGGLWDHEAAADDVRRIVEAQRDFWGKLPYDHYLFLNVVGESGGGLEHDNCTLLMTSRWSYQDRAAYRGWLGLVSHELFHAWNVRRLRPVALRSYDYENENYFNELWIAEGVTSYYDDLLQLRAGLLTQKDYLSRLQSTLARVMKAPGTEVETLRESSYDAWIKFYRPDENTVNSRISYYTKGALVAWLLDAKIRLATDNQKSLDDVMRTLYEQHSDRGYSLDTFRKTVDTVVNDALTEPLATPLSDFLVTAVDRSDRLDFTPVAECWGLSVGGVTAAAPNEADEADQPDPSDAKADADADAEFAEDSAEQDAPAAPTVAAAAEDKSPETPYVGANLRSSEGRMVISQVIRGGPADRAGWNVDDELLGMNQFRVDDSFWKNQLKFFPAGQPIRTLLARRGHLIERTLIPDPPTSQSWDLKTDAAASETQQSRREKWLSVTVPVESTSETAE